MNLGDLEDEMGMEGLELRVDVGIHCAVRPV
jgi:hypothetical protein